MTLSMMTCWTVYLVMAQYRCPHSPSGAGQAAYRCSHIHYFTNWLRVTTINRHVPGFVFLFVLKGKFVLFNDASKVHWFSHLRLLDIKLMVIVISFFRGNPLSPYRLLFSISSKRSFFICTFPLPLMDQLWTENSPNCKCIRCALPSELSHSVC